VQRECTLAGGDDYELLFTAPPAKADAVNTAAARAQVAVTRIGRIEAVPGLRMHDAGGQALVQTYRGFDHFRS
jgi:thiamine-monophosphate kinase